MIPRHLAIAVAVMFAVTIGMSVYIWRTRRMVPTEPAAYSHPVAPPVEELTIASLARTLSANVPGINRIKILVDGKGRDTLAGHADISGFYDVEAVDQLAAELQ